MPDQNKLLTARDLTRGEKLYLYRLRLGYTQEQRCVDLGIGFAEYRAMELDSPATKPPYLSIGKMEERESYMIFRRRHGFTKGQLAKEIGCSVEWLRQMEQGRAPIKRLQQYWESVL